MADLGKEKFSLQWIQCITLLNGLSCFSTMADAILLYTTAAVVPMPPEVVNTSGEKDPCSISRTLSS